MLKPPKCGSRQLVRWASAEISWLKTGDKSLLVLGCYFQACGGRDLCCKGWFVAELMVCDESVRLSLWPGFKTM